MNPINRTTNTNPTQPSPQHEQTRGVLDGVPVSSSLGGCKPTPAQVRAAGFSPLTRNPQVKATSTEPSAPPLASHLTASHLPSKASGDIKTSDKLRNLAITYLENGNNDGARILNLQADFIEGQDQQFTLKQSFGFPEGYPYTTMRASDFPKSALKLFDDECSLFQEYKKGAEYCQKFLKYYQKNPSQKAAIMKHATNLENYCKCINNVSQELKNGKFNFDTSKNAKQLLAISKQVDQDLWNFENLPSCSIS